MLQTHVKCWNQSLTLPVFASVSLGSSIWHPPCRQAAKQEEKSKVGGKGRQAATKYQRSLMLSPNTTKIDPHQTIELHFLKRCYFKIQGTFICPSTTQGCTIKLNQFQPSSRFTHRTYIQIKLHGIKKYIYINI